MKNSIKKRIFAFIFALTLAASMVVPAFAVDEGLDQSDVYPAYRYMNAFAGQALNAFTDKGYGEDYNGINVTTWASDPSDKWQKWVKLSYYDGSCRLGCGPNYWYALEYYWGSSNPSNADLYWTSPFSNDISTAKDAALLETSLGNSNYSFRLKFYPTLYLTAKYATQWLGGNSYHDVFWATEAQASSNYRTWNQSAV